MDETEILEWKDFARHLRRLARWDLERIDSALKEAFRVLPDLESFHRAELLNLGGLVAERSSKLAVQFLRLAPGALIGIAPPVRSPFLKWARVLAKNSREGLLEFLARGPGVLGSLSVKEGARFLALGQDLAEADWAISIKFFTKIPRIHVEIQKENLNSWFKNGQALIPGNPAAAMAYFLLESKKAWQSEKEAGSKVALKEAAGPLKILVQALTGKPMGFRSLEETEGTGSRSAGQWPFTDGESIFLPGSGYEFPSADLNFRALKVAAAHQAGQVEFGTFSFRLGAVREFFPREVLDPCWLSTLDREKPISPLEAFFNLFPKRNLARDLFSVLEGSRVDHCLKRNYRGLGADMALLLPGIFENRPPIDSLPLQEAFVEILLRLGASAKIPDRIPRTVAVPLEQMAGRISVLSREGATVGDSARLTAFFYQWLARIPNLPFTGAREGPGAKGLPSLVPPLAGQERMEFATRIADGEEPYHPLLPLSHRGELRPELVRKKMRIRKIRNLLEEMKEGIPLSPQALRDLLEKGVEFDLDIFEGSGEEFSQGLLATDLPDLVKKALVRGKGMGNDREKLKSELTALLSEMTVATGERSFYYDEWDYLIADYRVEWCRLREKGIQDETPDFVRKTLEAHAALVKEVRRQFQMLKPERFKRIRRLERGEEIDLDEAVEAAVDRRAGKPPSEKIYAERNRKDRDFSTLFLVDMSASTDEKAEGKGKGDPKDPPPGDQKVIDIEKEALVVMAEALDELGDEYAIFGFSGYGRKEVDFFKVKDFQEEYGGEVKGRIGGIKAQRSTRMGTAIRHAAAKLAGREQKVKNIILISDGYPQDYDYGEDRTSREYALKDTMRALEEAARENIHAFCITVDRAGHDYLRGMFPASRYLVIEETRELPRELPKIYRRLTT